MKTSGDHPLKSECPSEEEFTDFVAGRLSPEQTEKQSQHLEACPHCQARLAELDEAEPGSIDRILKSDVELPFTEEADCQKAVDRVGQPGTRGGGLTLSGDLWPTSVPRAENVSPRAIPEQIGDYRILRELGEGAMSVVYEGRHTKTGGTFAVKVLHPRHKTGESVIRRFRREMEAIGQLDHPNIVRAIDAGEEGGIQYLVMEYVEGSDLARLSGKDPLDVAAACELIRQAALGLDYAHRHGRVHRDVKPSNLMLDRDGRVKLLDLGLARLADEVKLESEPDSDLNLVLAGSTVGLDLTQAQQVMGTLGYMAPEQATDSHSVDARADVYSLGCTLYKLLSGKPPFGDPQYASSAGQILAHAEQPVPPIRDRNPAVPEALQAVIERMLVKQPEDRYATAAEVAEALAPFAQDDKIGELTRSMKFDIAGSTVDMAGQTLVGSQSASERSRRQSSWPLAIGSMILLCAMVIGGRQATKWFITPSDLGNVDRSADPYTVDVGELAPITTNSKIKEKTVETTEYVPVDLLALIDVERDAPVGDWSWDGERIVSNEKRTSVLQIPYVPPSDYRIEATVERVAEIEGMCFGIALGNGTEEKEVRREALVAIDNWARYGYLTGPHQIDGKKLDSHANPYRGQVLPPGKPVSLQLTVNSSDESVSLLLSADGKEVFPWSGKAHQLHLLDEYLPTVRNTLFLRVYNTSIGISKLRVVPLSPGGQVVDFGDRANEPEVAAARRCLWKGAPVTIFHGGETKEIRQFFDLPAAFSLREIGRIPVRRFVPDDLTYLANLPNSYSKELDLSAMDLAGSPWQLAGMPELERLILCRARVSGEQLAGLVDSKNFEYLDLTAGRLDDSLSHTISKLGMLRTLKLSYADVTHQSLTSLAQLPRLEELDLGYTDVTDASLSALTTRESLTNLSLMGTAVSDASAEELSTLNNLRELNVVGTDLTEAGIERLEAALPDCRVLDGYKKLNLLKLTDPRFGSLTGKWHMANHALSVPKVRLPKLRLPFIPPAEYDLEATVEAKSGRDSFVVVIVLNGQEAMVGFDHQPSKGWYTILHGIDGKHELNSNEKKRGQSFPVGKNVRIAIRVRRNHITVLRDDVVLLDWQGDFRRIKKLGYYSVGNTGALGLSSHAGDFDVKDLTLTPVSGRIDVLPVWPIPRDSISRLAKRICELHGEATVSRSGQVPEILNADRPLTDEPLLIHKISFPEGTELTDADLALLGQVDHLRELQLAGVKFSSDGFSHLGSLRYLTSLDLSNTEVTDENLRQLARLSRLADLRLANTRITGNGLAYLGSMNTLRHLDVSGTQIEDNVWRTLTEFHNLESLDGSDSTAGDEAVERLVELPLLHLNLAGTRVTDQGIHSLASRPTLSSLALDRTSISDSALSELSHLQNLTTLSVEYTGVTYQGIKRFQSALPNCEVRSGLLWGVSYDDRFPDARASLSPPQELLRLIELDSDGNLLHTNANVLLARGDTYAQARRWEEALDDYDAAISLYPTGDWTESSKRWAHWKRTALVLMTGDRILYRQRCFELASVYTENKFYSKPLVIVPWAVDDPAIPLQIAADTVSFAGEEHSNYPWILFEKALAEYRNQHFDQTIEDLTIMRGRRDNIHESTRFYNDAIGYLLQAMAHHQLGQHEPAHDFYIKAKDSETQIAQQNADGIHVWWDWIHLQVLREEAEDLFSDEADQ